MNETIVFIPFNRLVEKESDIMFDITDVKGFTQDDKRVSFMRHVVGVDADTGKKLSVTFDRIQ